MHGMGFQLSGLIFAKNIMYNFWALLYLDEWEFVFSFGICFLLKQGNWSIVVCPRAKRKVMGNPGWWSWIKWERERKRRRGERWSPQPWGKHWPSKVRPRVHTFMTREATKTGLARTKLTFSLLSIFIKVCNMIRKYQHTVSMII